MSNIIARGRTSSLQCRGDCPSGDIIPLLLHHVTCHFGLCSRVWHITCTIQVCVVLIGGRLHGANGNVYHTLVSDGARRTQVHWPNAQGWRPQSSLARVCARVPRQMMCVLHWQVYRGNIPTIDTLTYVAQITLQSFKNLNYMHVIQILHV